MNANNSQTQTEAQTPEEAADLLRSLREGDQVQFSGDTWKVISEAEDDFTAVEFRSLTGYHPGTTTLKPSSGFRGSAVVTHSAGMGSHYGSITVTARDLEAHQPEQDEDEGGAPSDSGFQGEETTTLGGKSVSELLSRGEEDEDEQEDEPVIMTDGGVNVQTFQFQDEEDAEDVDLTFRVTDSYTNRYGDQKAAVETPAPWDTPDGMTAANDVVKTLPWGEDDTAEDDDREGAHYTFDRDREAWTLDAEYLRDLAELAQDAGYDWEGVARSEAEDETEAQAALRELAGAAEEGDTISVTYAKKNGNGLKTYKGEVELAQVGNDAQDPWERRSTGVVFTDTNGKTKRVKPDDDGTPALFSSGYHPFMGVLVSVELEQ
ncbi:hypothetical protein M197_gp37 [Haloarcula hispanica tailed virus 2]|uniref:Uncharacterized protein n=1 Tax=Haloarcula hispanica tailed virus 2 TaxID=1273751 RepID=R4TKK1_9CAUD|nr:hypothetical protein M197_gp37 [Haloarcula hispanica tailed virus 2]AGM11202.1 hypothetical protein HHTV2_37 [Haloarcula hispanica tailed virus 2]